MDAVERGLSDVTLVLLSPESIPKPWKRERWEPVFLKQPSAFGTQIGFVLLRECKFPELLRRGNFFDLTASRLDGQRQVKRWLLESAQGLPDFPATDTLSADRLEELRRALSDQPGTASDMPAAEALAFAHAAMADFEGVFYIDCRHRSRAGILGDVAQSLGLRLSGTLDRNRAALEEFCAGRRCLFVFENIAPEQRELVAFGGKTSAILTAHTEEASKQDPFELFTSWTRRSNECLGALGAAHRALEKESWPRALQLGSSMVAFLRHWDRLAEAYEVLGILLNSAHDHADFQTIHRLKWEQSWILEHWQQPVSLPAATQPNPTQLSLNLQ